VTGASNTVEVTSRNIFSNQQLGVIYGMAGIRVKEGESFEGALKRFKKKCEKAGILSDLRRHQYFEKPSERKKRKAAAARRKMVKNQTMQRG
jgi:small subunit ribosomal protein S21